MSQGADDTYPWKILANQMRAEMTVLKQTDMEITRLQGRKVELASRIEKLETAIIALGGDLEEARRP